MRERERGGGGEGREIVVVITESTNSHLGVTRCHVNIAGSHFISMKTFLFQ